MIDLLTKTIEPPKDLRFRPAAADWHRAERKLGLRLPADYKKVIEFYGDSYWSDFLFLLNPFSENKNLNLFSRLEMMLAAERATRAEFPHYYPFPLYPEAGGLLPFFITDNGDAGFWLTFSEPEKWSILIKGARPPEFEVHFIKVSAFLYQFTAGNFHSIVLPSNHL